MLLGRRLGRKRSTGNPETGFPLPKAIHPIVSDVGKRFLDALNAEGVGPVELPNPIKARLDDVVAACDGSVDGLIVSSLED